MKIGLGWIQDRFLKEKVTGAREGECGSERARVSKRESDERESEWEREK